MKTDLIGDLEDYVVICHAVWEQRHFMSGLGIGMVWSDAALNWGSKGQLRGTGCLQQAVRFIPGEELSYINLIDIALK